MRNPPGFRRIGRGNERSERGTKVHARQREEASASQKFVSDEGCALLARDVVSQGPARVLEEHHSGAVELREEDP